MHVKKIGSPIQRMHRVKSWLALMLMAATFAGISGQANAMAYCALRDPVNTIYELFPAADSYRSSVRTVDRRARQAVLEKLPFSLHFNELGRHTLYVAQIGKAKTLGFVHARSELEEWGITEYAWALSPKLEVTGVKVQRSRDPLNKSLVTTPNYASVIGKNVESLVAQYDVAIGRKDMRLASFIASALKSIVITRSVWRDEVDEAARLGVLQQIFPRSHELQQIDTLLPDKTLKKLASLEMQSSPIFDRSLLQGSLVMDAQGDALGIFIEAPLTDAEPARTLWWFVANDGLVMRVVNDHTLVSDLDFANVIGIHPPTELASCSTLADLAALEISTIARTHIGVATH